MWEINKSTIPNELIGFTQGASLMTQLVKNVGDLGLVPGLGRSPWEEKGYPLQYSGLENSMDCIVHRVAKSWTRLNNFHFHFSLSCIGEGNGNPLQCSSLQNPRDGGPGELPSMESHRVGHDWSDLAAAATLFDIALFWDWNENQSFPVMWTLLSFPNLLAYWVQHFHSIIF